MPEGEPPLGAPVIQGVQSFMPVDPVTGAFNMPVFIAAFKQDVLNKELDRPALWYVDIRNFRSINPKFGFLKGNIVLRTLVDGIRELLSGELPMARLGADRVVFIVQGINEEQAKEKFRGLVDYVNAKCYENGISAYLSLAAGVYYLRQLDYDSGNHNHAMDYASIAHRNAKHESGNSLALFTDEDLEKDIRRITLEQSIDIALAERQIEVWYQPQVDYIYGEVIGAEALARWNHPELGWVSPAEFIPVLENCGKIHELDLFVWEEACRNAGRWRNASDGKPVPISVNVSRREVFEDDLLEHFLNLQRKYDLPVGSLHIEVTESAFVEEADRLYSVIEDLRSHNVLVEMDDFGSGLSSLNMLQDVPVDVVKLDMGFLKSALGEDRGGVILGAVIRMLQGLGTPIVAEGVETLEQAEMLKNMGCHLMQGYHFSRPMPLKDFESFIASNNAVEDNIRRTKTKSHLEDLTSLDPTSSYLFNNALGPMLFFFEMNGFTESILVNDQFYEACGLERTVFGDSRISPINEIEESSRGTLFRAATEAREYGASLCHAQVRLTGRWIDCIMRYLGTNKLGHVFSLNIFRWSDSSNDDHSAIQFSQDRVWALGMLNRIIKGGFLKCAVDDELTFDSISPGILEQSGLPQEEFMRRFHNSFAQYVTASYRAELQNAIRYQGATGALIEQNIAVYSGYNDEKPVTLFGRVEPDENGNEWFHALLLFRDVDDEATLDVGDEAAQHSERIIPFDYYFNEDKLVVHRTPITDEQVVRSWTKKIEHPNSAITKSSAATVLATLRDLLHHPSSGFADLKCNFGVGDDLRWYHINYTCESDADGVATLLHGFAQDANDQIGSTKWWRRQAEIDQLTGLLNRNAAEQDINLAMRIHGAGMMFMIDLDGFKRVNDELGHLSGDALLRDVAATLSEHFRESDVLGRYGGDEFVAFVPVAFGNPQGIAKSRCKEIIEAISSIEIPDGTHAACSVGVAISHNHESTFYDLLEVADRAMYQSKLAGKGTYTLIEMDEAPRS